MNKLMIIMMFLAFGCSSGKDSTQAPAGATSPVVNNDEKKKINNMTYSQSSFVFRNQMEILALYYPTYYGSVATSFSVSPALPAGLNLSTLSGRIAGTPEEVISTPRIYHITAINQYGSHTIDISIQIIDQAPFGLRYNVAQVDLLKNISEISLFPTSNDGIRGGAKIRSYSVSPNLPPGLAFDVLTGAIEGISTSSFTARTFTITGSNNGGSVATQVVISSSSSLSTIVAGGKHTCAIIDSQVQCWGDNKFGQLGISPIIKLSSTVGNSVPYSFSPIRKILVGSENTCVTQTDSKLYCFGRNKDGQLGQDAFQTLYYSPTYITDLIIDGSLSKHGYDNSSTFAHACSTSNGGYGYCAGEYPFGNLSSFDYEVRSSLTSAAVPYISTITSGSNFTCFVSFQKAYCFGNNSYGQLGDNQSSGVIGSHSGVVPVGLDSEVNLVAAGKNFACAIKSGKVYCWGDNIYGQLGDSSFTSAQSNIPILVKGLPADKPISNITAGNNHACALIESQSYCWGDNQYGQIGNKGVGSTVLIPTKLLTQSNESFEVISQITAGEEHTCMLSSNSYYCWGRNDKGQLGTQDNVNYNYPKKVILAN